MDAMKAFLFALIALLTLACTREPARSDLFSAGNDLGEVPKRLEEASGLVASHLNEGMFWSLNDGGNPPEVYLIDQQARIRLTCRFPNLRNRDWEDIGIGAGPDEGQPYVYIADIGDNDAVYDYKMIYRFKEPVLANEKSLVITLYDTLVLKMPDGKRDTEAIMTDPLNNDLYVVSKRENEVGLYRALYPFTSDSITLTKTATLHLTSIVAGSISSDGGEVLLKNYAKVYYWKREKGESITDLLQREPIKLKYDREPQGEAICWSRDGSAYYTVSESRGKNASLMEYKRKP